MKESAIEKAVCDFARRHGCIVMKLSGPNQKGQPDRMFLRGSKVLFIEFKASTGGRVTALQEKWLRDLRHQGFPAFVCSDVEAGKQLVTDHLSDV